MVVSIDKLAWNDPGSNYTFRTGTISALKRVIHSGHTLFLNENELSETQQNLLKQEDIEFIREVDEADILIKSKGNGLALHKKGEEVLSSDDWPLLLRYLHTKARAASLQRKTNETNIEIEINLDGAGKSDIATGLNFFDHMLEQISRHGLIDMKLECDGDLEVDEHHTIEDVAIALGEIISKALGNKKGIERYGFVLPMDEAQATVALDLSGRPYLVFEGDFKREYVGDMPTEMVRHFFYSLAMNLKATIHVSFSGDNDHHKIEACFKGLARALKMAIEQNERIKNQIPSSKGSL